MAVVVAAGSSAAAGAPAAAARTTSVPCGSANMAAVLDSKARTRDKARVRAKVRDRVKGRAVDAAVVAGKRIADGRLYRQGWTHRRRCEPPFARVGHCTSDR